MVHQYAYLRHSLGRILSVVRGRGNVHMVDFLDEEGKDRIEELQDVKVQILNQQGDMSVLGQIFLLRR